MKSLKEIKCFLNNSIVKEASEIMKETGQDSIDAQIDKYFMSYESEATHLKNEGVDLYAMTRNFLLEKAETEDKEAPGVVKTPDDIDIRAFCFDVARLIDNASSLLEFKNTIVRRAINYLAKSYDDETVRKFKITMEDDFDLAAGDSEFEPIDEKVPTAGEAGPVGSTTA